MTDEKRFLVDVGLQDFPFPVRATSKVDADGQPTIASVSVRARIMQAFEARWIDKFVQILHEQRGPINVRSLSESISEYVAALNAATVRIDCDYPYFVEKWTPISKEKCLVRYRCTYSAKASSPANESRFVFKMELPCITTYPVSRAEDPGGLFGQLSLLFVEVESANDIYPEDLVELVDRHALSPVYSFLTEEDQIALIDKIHSEKRTSVVVVDEVKTELAHDPDIAWYAVRCCNFGMLHSYSTVIRTNKSRWVPFSGYDEEI